MTRSKLFISYSHKDKRWLDRIREQLAVLEREGLIDTFEDTRIAVGEDWYARLDQEMLGARIALLLISAPFLTSDFIRRKEIPRLFDQHEAGGMDLYPLLVRDCAWQEVPWLARIQIRPKDARPIAAMRGATLDKCLADVAREIAAIVKLVPAPKATQSLGTSSEGGIPVSFEMHRSSKEPPTDSPRPNLSILKSTSTPPSAAPSSALPQLSYGTWTLHNAIDAEGKNWSNSVLKFTSQEETSYGLALRGTITWRLDNILMGTEEFAGHYVSTVRQVILEGEAVRDVPHAGPDRLAVGSYSAVVSQDERALLDGRWGSTAQHEPGVSGMWEATR